MQVKFAKNENDWRSCYGVMSQLRTHLDLEEFINQVKIQAESGYQLAYVEKDQEILAVAGFVIGHKLAWGKSLYIDDLVTDQNRRSEGAGKMLLDALKTYAKEQGCKELHLDSGVHRFEAHRFYLRERMDISSHHFHVVLKD